MCPIDPARTAEPSPRAPMAPPFEHENVNLESVLDGLEVAEDETRDAVADAYEKSALASDDPEKSLDDIDYGEKDSDPRVQELAAIHEEGDGEELPEDWDGIVEQDNQEKASVRINIKK